MISILAPSKTLDFSASVPPWVIPGEPWFNDDATCIAQSLAALDATKLAELMHVSEAIAKVNHDRLAKWGEVKKPALWAYRGDVYKGMYADRLSQSEAEWAQMHLRIMSGMYGVLRPYDVISPYRLEMKTKVALSGSKDLYGFWGYKLAEVLDSESGGAICNLSSDEYAKSVIKYATSHMVTPVFMDHKPNGRVGQVPIYSKMMRGVMAHWIVTKRIDHPDLLRNFTEHGYEYDDARSTDAAPVFVRSAPMIPLVF